MNISRHYIWPVALALTIFLVSGTNRLATPDLGWDFSYDKIAHILVFGLLATSVLRIPHIYNKGWKGVLITIVFVSGYGIFDEFRQSFTPGRFVEFDDWVADTLGATIASIVYYKWHWYRRLWERRSRRYQMSSKKCPDEGKSA